MSRLVLTLLYVPADRSDRVAKAVAAGADVVLLDLEDAVAPGRKAAAREGLAGLITAAQATGFDPARIQVRINGAATDWRPDDLAAVAALPQGVGVRLPKVESAGEVRAVAAALPGRPLTALLESALGIERAFEIATADPQLRGIGIGEADLAADLGIGHEDGLLWARSRVVVAARAAGLPAPAMSVHPRLRDPEGLRASCRRGRALGFLGRAAIHPEQLPVIREAFRPDADEVAAAREVLDRIGDAHAQGVGAIALADGSFLDVAMVERARRTLALALATEVAQD